MPNYRISIIIPALNEAASIQETLDSTRTSFPVERILVDGGSRDGTPDLAGQWGTRVIVGASGRARQMNLGARHAEGRILLFLHADTCLPRGFAEEIEAILRRPGVVCGAFRIGIESAGRSLRIIEAATNLRSRWFQMPYGDQALFLTSEVFRQMGGYRDLPIMEDFDLVLRLRRKGRIALASQSILTSARRWEKLGPWKTTAINQIAIAAYFLGVPVSRIAEFYYRRSRGSHSIESTESTMLSVCEQFGKNKETLRTQQTSNRA